MPDWSYLTVGQPVLFRLRPSTARKLVLKLLATTSRPFGGQIIDLLGHMRVAGADLGGFGADRFSAGPVCMSSCIDPDLKAIRAFERFGFGALLIGPFGSSCRASTILRDDESSSISIPLCESDLSLEEISWRLRSRRLRSVKIILQCQVFTDPDDIRKYVATLHHEIDAIVVSLDVASSRQDLMFPILVHVRSKDMEEVKSLGQQLGHCVGFYVDGSQVVDQLQTNEPTDLVTTRRLTNELREHFGSKEFILGAGGVYQPSDALQLIDAGANAVSLDAGLVFGGPGLAKRINESLEARTLQQGAITTEPEKPVMRSTWVWTMAMGIAMILGGFLATVIAMTRVLLPYDESLVGMTRFELATINDRLLDFMKHDRITLAGTMLGVGGLYSALSWQAVRRGAHWAGTAVFLSAFAGFASFFLFLGFGYFDPFHAFVTAILFQFLLMAVFSHDASPRRHCYADLYNDRAWRWALWGQLLFILHGATLIVAGLVICTVGITTVFVAEDMEFLCTTPEKLISANPQLVPLVAHDRATFGGMLISCGIAVSLTALWGFRRGASWIWWMLLSCCLVPYLMTILVHHAVGYVDMKHLLPAYVGVAALCLGSWLTRDYLVAASHQKSSFK